EAKPETAPTTDPYAVARDLLAKGLVESASAEVHRTLRRGGATAAGIALLGEIFARRGLHGEALERFRQAKLELPNDPGVLAGEAAALLGLDRAEEAREVADRLVELAPDQPESYEL